MGKKHNRYDTDRFGVGSGWTREYRIVCVNCGAEFTAGRLDASFCSGKCRVYFGRRQKTAAARAARAVADVLALSRDESADTLAALAKIERVARSAVLDASQQKSLL